MQKRPVRVELRLPRGVHKIDGVSLDDPSFQALLASSVQACVVLTLAQDDEATTRHVARITERTRPLRPVSGTVCIENLRFEALSLFIEDLRRIVSEDDVTLRRRTTLICSTLRSIGLIYVWQLVELDEADLRKRTRGRRLANKGVAWLREALAAYSLGFGMKDVVDLCRSELPQSHVG